MYKPIYSFGALVWLVIILLAGAVLAGAALGETEILNPMISEARADEMSRATEYQSQVDELDLEYREQALAAQAAAQEEQRQKDAEFQEQQRELELTRQRERVARELELAPIRAAVLWGATSLALLAIAGGLTYCLITWGQQGNNLKQSTELWKDTRVIAQANEQLINRLQVSQQQVVELQQQVIDSQQQMASFQRQVDKVFAIDGNGRQRDTRWIEQ